ncbi:jg15115 [Pararge aegeria aegeria]|uniref:Jg15115 protein n=1 Tax=Pararge aegeria aegeria TaxID=348720 RepID=A0A8S4RI33_9NEOP|nr:jg15115 [Pararge aegeria aegeria]
MAFRFLPIFHKLLIGLVIKIFALWILRKNFCPNKTLKLKINMELLDVMKNLTIKHVETKSEQKLFNSIAADIDDVPTEIVISEYTDKTLLIISQYQNIGSMLMVQRDQVHSPLGVDNIYTTKVIFGATGEEQQVAVRYLAEAINITKPLCIFINLKSYDIETVKACKDIILDLKREERE